MALNTARSDLTALGAANHPTLSEAQRLYIGIDGYDGAGADLNWMSRMVSYTRDENIRDSSLLAKMYALIDECPLPVVGRIQGAAIGGGVGLVSVCDVAVATPRMAQKTSPQRAPCCGGASVS